MKNTIEHKGYVAELTVDTEDNCIYAEVINAPTANLMTEGATPVAVESAYQSLIDDYLSGMAARGLAPAAPKVMAAT